MSRGDWAGPGIFEEQAHIAKQSLLALGGYVVLATAIYSIVDIFFYDSDGLYFVSSIVVWGLGYMLLVVLMQATAAEGERHEGGLGGYFVLGLLAGIAILVGVLCLIVPGIYLMMRWLPAYARLYDANDGVTQAIGWSWEATEPHQKELALALIGPLAFNLVWAAIAVGQEFYMDEWSETTLDASFVVFNLAISMGIAWSQLLGVASYRMIQRRSVAAVEAFA